MCLYVRLGRAPIDKKRDGQCAMAMKMTAATTQREVHPQPADRQLDEKERDALGTQNLKQQVPENMCFVLNLVRKDARSAECPRLACAESLFVSVL